MYLAIWKFLSCLNIWILLLFENTCHGDHLLRPSPPTAPAALGENHTVHHSTGVAQEELPVGSPSLPSCWLLPGPSGPGDPRKWGSEKCTGRRGRGHGAFWHLAVTVRPLISMHGGARMDAHKHTLWASCMDMQLKTGIEVLARHL